LKARNLLVAGASRFTRLLCDDGPKISPTSQSWILDSPLSVAVGERWASRYNMPISGAPLAETLGPARATELDAGHSDDGTITTAFLNDCSNLFAPRVHKLQGSWCSIFAVHGFVSDPLKLVLSSRPWQSAMAANKASRLGEEYVVTLPFGLQRANHHRSLQDMEVRTKPC
jgi:hypothetical protein